VDNTDLREKYHNMYLELAKDEHQLFMKKVLGTLTHEEYRVYETITAISEALLNLNDYLHASSNKSTKYIINKKAIE
jgi:hypothetical protein